MSSTVLFPLRSPGGTWKPAVTPVGNVPAPSPVGGAPAAVTKTSLAYQGPASPAIGSGHNLSARPFNATPQVPYTSSSFVVVQFIFLLKNSII